MQSKENLVYLLLGGNLGDVRKVFSIAMDKIRQHIGDVCNISPLYRSEPWGFQSEDAFLNQVVCVKTCLQPKQVLEMALSIEAKLGRKRSNPGYASRAIDIDILFYNDNIINTGALTVPHPRLHLRNFTLRPLNDVSPQLLHPVLGKTISELLLGCEDKHLALPLGNE